MSQAAVRNISELQPDVADQVNQEKLQGAIEMAGAVCHELSQPLMALCGYSKLISMGISEDDPLNEKIIKFMGQVDRLGEITQKLMRISKYETTEYLDGKIIDLERAAG